MCLGVTDPAVSVSVVHAPAADATDLRDCDTAKEAALLEHQEHQRRFMAGVSAFFNANYDPRVGPFISKPPKRTDGRDPLASDWTHHISDWIRQLKAMNPTLDLLVVIPWKHNPNLSNAQKNLLALPPSIINK